MPQTFFQISTARESDYEAILAVYARARVFMAEHGNPDQWGKNKPLKEDVRKDILNGNSRVLRTFDGEIAGCFSLFPGPDETYFEIAGSWLSDSPYLAIHKVASSGKYKGVFAAIVSYCAQFGTDLRIDTHEQNTVMQNAILKQGFQRCGIIRLKNGEPRIAFQRIRGTKISEE